jgi:hypothetical protein
MADNPPGSGIPILGPILDTLTAIFSNQTVVQDLANRVETVEENAWANTIQFAGWAYGLHAAELDLLGKQLDWLKKELAHIFHDLIWHHIVGILKAIWKQLTDKHSWLHRMIAWLQQLQRIQRQYQLQTLKRAIDLIQRVRKVLVVFRLFHLKFAQKLDSWLAGIEGKLIHGTFEIARKTNEILGWVNVIADPTGFHNAKWLWGSIGRDLSAFAAAARALDIKLLFPKQTNQVWTDVPATPHGPVKQIGV